jgi:hypothetical protein
MEIAVEKVAHVIVKAREYDAKVPSWEDASEAFELDDAAESILESRRDDATRGEVAAFIAGLNDDEQAELVALAWVGRGSFDPEDWDEAVETARGERVNRTEDYLLGIPLLADYLEEGLEKMGYCVEDAEEGIL